MPLDLTVDNFDQETSTGTVLVDFWAPWCGPCKAIASTVNALSAEYAGKAKVAKVNIDDNFALSEKYNIRAVPTFIVFKDGQIVSTMTGGTTKAKLVAAIDSAIG